MRSAAATALAIVGLATALAVVVLIVQTVGMRSDVGQLRERLTALETDVVALAEREPGVDRDELNRQLDDLESGIRDWLIATGADGFDPDASGAPGGADGADDREVLEGINDILDRIEALENRLDEICEGIPVC